MKYTVLLSLLSYQLFLASAAPAENDNLVEVHREPALGSTGSLVSYADRKRSVNDGMNMLTRRDACTGFFGGRSETETHCDKNHGAPNDACTKLSYELTLNAGNEVQKSPRQLCFEGDGGKCCVSWSSEIKNKVTKGDLRPFVDELQTACTQEGISGRKTNVDLFGTCTTVCVSDRGTKCR